MIIQQQVLKEVYSTASSLGVSDPKLLGELLSSCVNPAVIIDRNSSFRLMDLNDQMAMTIPINSLIAPIKHYLFCCVYHVICSSLPSSHLPVTSISCKAGDDTVVANSNIQADISHIWDAVPESVSSAIPSTKLSCVCRKQVN